MNHDSDFVVDACSRIGRDAGRIGGKAANLLRLQGLGQPVPPWFAVTADAFHAALAASGLDRRIEDAGRGGDAAALASVREWITGVDLPAGLRAAVLKALGGVLPPGGFVAVRSSAVDEDGAGQSFAGLHDSFLFLRTDDDILDALRKVWASAYNERAIAYRRERGLAVTGIAVAVVVQQMVDAITSGVMFTINPVTGGVHETVISALYGLGEGLVSQGFDADTFTVRKDSLAITPALAEKRERMVVDAAAGRGLVRESVPEELRARPCLTDDQVLAVTRAGGVIERHYGRPQDIEFAFDAAGRLHLLQTRPVTTAAEYGPAAGNHLIWDNSNIIESYSGVTSPLTFSFIRRAYTIVYHCFSQVMGIPDAVVQKSQPVFENMLGLFRGQVYYNLLNWYRLVRLFPGFSFNKQFMESMMGLREPAELKDEVAAPGFARRMLVELPRLVRLLLRTSWNFLRIRTWVRRFDDNFQSHYRRWSALRFSEMQPHELMRVYREMEETLLWNWRAPIINDFYVMVFYGVLKKLCATWCGDERGSLQNDLICGEGGIESTEPTRLLLRLAAVAQRDDVLRHLILNDEPARLVRVIDADPRFAEFAAGFHQYLDLYGFRCMNELKLEEYSLRDRPEFVFTILRNYLALNRPEALDTDAMSAREQTIRAEAETRAFASLSPWRRLVFRRVLRNARLGVKNRENMRFARTRIYGMIRDLFRAFGARLADEGILHRREDVFCLTLDECQDFVKGTAVTTRLAELAELRRREFDDYRAAKEGVPDDRFETYGMACHKNLLKNTAAATPVAADGKLRGTGCCPGEREGPVKVMRSPRDDMKLSGEILVAERTDPGWVPLYPSVSGLLIERGSILSHSAIVAREMGIPTIVGIPELVARLSTGMRVRMDGAAGTVEIMDPPTPESTPPSPAPGSAAPPPP
jgi:rifampicin phosphotransferase